MTEITYSVPGMSCAHCERAIESEVAEVAGVSEIAVDLKSKQVRVRGDALDDAALRAAIQEAGYEAV